MQNIFLPEKQMIMISFNCNLMRHNVFFKVIYTRCMVRELAQPDKPYCFYFWENPKASQELFSFLQIKFLLEGVREGNPQHLYICCKIPLAKLAHSNLLTSHILKKKSSVANLKEDLQGLQSLKLISESDLPHLSQLSGCILGHVAW